MIATFQDGGLGRGYASGDSSFASVIALVHGQSALDSGPLKLTVSGTGVTFNSTGVAQKWNTGSVFNGSSQSAGTKFASIAHNAGFTPAADFTVEMWIYLTNNSTFQVFCYKATDGGTGVSPFELWLNSSGKLNFFGNKSDNTTLYNIAGTTTITANAWHFIQGRRSGNTFACALDGTQEATVTVAGAVQSNSAQVTVGNFASVGASNILGYWQDFRFTNGVARAFAVPTSEFENS